MDLKSKEKYKKKNEVSAAKKSFGTFEPFAAEKKRNSGRC
jgi:hypothetical protein